MENKPAPPAEKKVTREYTLNFKVFSDGSSSLIGENSGFSVCDLIGILEWKKTDLIDQLEGKIRPDIIERKYIKTKKS